MLVCICAVDLVVRGLPEHLTTTNNPTFAGLTLSTGQLIGGVGAESTSGTLDWNDSTNARSGNGNTLLLGNATNGPTGTGAYFHAFSFEYASKDGSGNLTQFAVPYGNSTSIDAGMYMRGRFSGTWTSWVKILSENTSGAVNVTGTLTAGALTSTGTLTASNGLTLSAGTLSLPADSVTDAMVSNTLTSSIFAGSGSTTNAIDLATAEVAGTLSIARGGTNSTSTPTNGGIAYGTGTAYAFTSAGTSGQCLQSNGAATPTWGTCFTVSADSINFTELADALTLDAYSKLKAWK